MNRLFPDPLATVRARAEARELKLLRARLGPVVAKAGFLKVPAASLEGIRAVDVAMRQAAAARSRAPLSEVHAARAAAERTLAEVRASEGYHARRAAIAEWHQRRVTGWRPHSLDGRWLRPLSVATP